MVCWSKANSTRQSDGTDENFIENLSDDPIQMLTAVDHDTKVGGEVAVGDKEAKSQNYKPVDAISMEGDPLASYDITKEATSIPVTGVCDDFEEPSYPKPHGKINFVSIDEDGLSSKHVDNVTDGEFYSRESGSPATIFKGETSSQAIESEYSVVEELEQLREAEMAVRRELEQTRISEVEK